MMREIKFRIWDKKTKQIFEVGLWNISEYVFSSTYILMQYTGLKDVHGKEIYEGDIVIEGYKGKYGTYEVKWNVKGFNLGSEDGDEYEVIGNIYENPELLARDNK